MALRDRIQNYQPVATATSATLATLSVMEQGTVAKIATVAVAEEGNKELDQDVTGCQLGKNNIEKMAKPNGSSDTPAICINCERLDVVEMLGKPVPGCLYTAAGEYADGWKRIPDGLKKCMGLPLH